MLNSSWSNSLWKVESELIRNGIGKTKNEKNTVIVIDFNIIIELNIFLGVPSNIYPCFNNIYSFLH